MDSDHIAQRAIRDAHETVSQGEVNDGISHLMRQPVPNKFAWYRDRCAHSKEDGPRARLRTQ